MKKFLIIFLTVCMVISCMIVPSFAADAETYTVSGVWVFHNDTLTLMNHPSYSWSYIDVNYTVNGISCIRMDFNTEGSGSDRYTKFDARYADGGMDILYDSRGWIKDSNRTIDFGSTEQTVPQHFFEWLNENATFIPAPPLAEAVEELTMEQATKVQNQTVGVMKILVPCGVGCLALLMALPTLRKGFLRFLH